MGQEVVVIIRSGVGCTWLGSLADLMEAGWYSKDPLIYPGFGLLL